MKGSSWVVGFLLFISTACSTLRINSDYNPLANFSLYRTYAWPAENKNIAPDISGVPSELIEQRIRTAIDAQLKTKGLQKVQESDKPDLFILDYVTHRQKWQSFGAGTGFGYGYGPWGGAFSAPIYDFYQYTEGTLVLDLIDANTHQLVWRGIASNIAGDPKKSAERINLAVEKMLKEYPPQP